MRGPVSRWGGALWGLRPMALVLWRWMGSGAEHNRAGLGLQGTQGPPGLSIGARRDI
jgi:hypothetical protein